MLLTRDNYYSQNANIEFMSVSQYKNFLDCEARAMAELNGEWEPIQSDALILGSFVDAAMESDDALSGFINSNPQITKKDGSLKQAFQDAMLAVDRMKSDRGFMKYASGTTQQIRTAEFAGCKWKIRMDFVNRNRITDLKYMRSLDRIMGVSFVEHWKYDDQLAVYAHIDWIARRKRNKNAQEKDTFLAIATKEDPPNIEIIHVPKWRREECLQNIEAHMPHILEVKNGIVPAQRCEKCAYCRATKKITNPIEFDMVGLYEFYGRGA